MRKEDEKLIFALKRLIHVLTTGRKTPYEYGHATLYRAEVHILEIIEKNTGIAASDIAKDMGVTKGAISQIIAKLFAKGLLKKVFTPNNLKTQELHLTKKGMDVLSYHNEHEKELLKKVMPELNKCGTKDIDIFAFVIHSVADFVER